MGRGRKSPPVILQQFPQRGRQRQSMIIEETGGNENSGSGSRREEAGGRLFGKICGHSLRCAYLCAELYKWPPHRRIRDAAGKPLLSFWESFVGESCIGIEKRKAELFP